MYSVFLPFGAVVIDLFLVFMYFKHDFWLLGGTTAIFALFPLLVTSFLLYSKWTKLKLVSTTVIVKCQISPNNYTTLGNNLHWFSPEWLPIIATDNFINQILGQLQWCTYPIWDTSQSSM